MIWKSSIDNRLDSEYIICSGCISALPKGRVSVSENLLGVYLGSNQELNSERFAALKCDRNSRGRLRSSPLLYILLITGRIYVDPVAIYLEEKEKEWKISSYMK